MSSRLSRVAGILRVEDLLDLDDLDDLEDDEYDADELGIDPEEEYQAWLASRSTSPSQLEPPTNR